MAQQTPDREELLVDLGQALFFDANLSRDRTLSCASCHNPSAGFSDNRPNIVSSAASLGADGHSLGDRNAPSLNYTALTPDFHIDAEGNYAGGFFWDGRAPDLESQAGSPALNVAEMGMPDQAFVVARLRENDRYEQSFRTLFGDHVFAQETTAFEAMTQAIAAFERSELLSPFNSRYDRYLRGEYQPTPQETLGMALFFSPRFTSCARCHQLNAVPDMPRETFTNYRYENIGVPVNRQLRSANGLGEGYTDLGLGENPAVNGTAQNGRFKVPSLRNVALTGPYMHNGIFQELRTVLLFYNKYNTTGGESQTNPETGQPWGAPEVEQNIALDKLQDTLPLLSQQIDALLAFLHMLTDEPVTQLR